MSNKTELVVDAITVLLSLVFLFCLVYTVSDLALGGTMLGAFAGWSLGVSMLRVYQNLLVWQEEEPVWQPEEDEE